MIDKRYYVSGNTAAGFVNLLPSNVKSFAHTIILNHPSEKLKTAVINKLLKALESTERIEVLLSPLGDNYLDGIIVRNQAVAVIVDHIATKDLSGAIELNLSYFLDAETPDIKELQEQHKTYTNAAYQSFKEGLAIHDELEKIYIDEMDFKRADAIADQLIQQLLNKNISQKEPFHVYNRLFGTNTPQGAVNVVPELIESVSSVYYLKGRAGTGKSTFMRRVAAACEEEGLGMEKYFCSFDPGSVDMIHVPALDFAIFDSTAPHEYFPARTGEQVIDLYEEAVKPGTDERFADEISDATSRYKAKMKEGIRNLSEAGRVLEKAEDQFDITEKDTNAIADFILKNFYTL